MNRRRKTPSTPSISVLARALPIALGGLLAASASAPPAFAQSTPAPTAAPTAAPPAAPTPPAPKPRAAPPAAPTPPATTSPPAPPAPEPSATPTSPAPEPSGAPQPSTTTTEPPPGPGPDLPTDPPVAKQEIPPAKAVKATEVAKKANLTPIVPSPQDVLKPAFQLYAEIDLPVLGVGIVFAASRIVRTGTAYCAPKCDPSDLNALDRSVAGFYRPTWGMISDVGIAGLAGGSALLLVLDEGLLPAVNDLVVIAQSALIATVVPSLATLGVGRPRPYLYGEEAPRSVREGSDASLSFISSHTSMSFAIATSTFMAARRLHPNSAFQWVVLGVGLAGAAGVAASRVMAGSHFPTDVLAGAVTGSSIGVLLPSLHGSPVRVVPKLGAAFRGASFAYDF